MGAASLTGLSGPGMSKGKHKCKNQCGGCGCKCVDEPEPKTPPKTGCVTRISVGQKLTHKAGNGKMSIKGC
jgi:hypothetical protein